MTVKVLLGPLDPSLSSVAEALSPLGHLCTPQKCYRSGDEVAAAPSKDPLGCRKAAKPLPTPWPPLFWHGCLVPHAHPTF